MRHEIVLVPSAVADLRQLPSHLRPRIKQAIEDHLRHGPAATSRSRIKRLSGVEQPQYRLRVGLVRVFYDIDIADATVIILAIVPKHDAARWLAESKESE